MKDLKRFAWKSYGHLLDDKTLELVLRLSRGEKIRRPKRPAREVLNNIAKGWKQL